jgi:hypothetical protein
MSHLQARTIFVCNVTMLVLGSQTYPVADRMIYYNNVNQSTRTFLPINTSRIISYNTITMAFVTTYNCNTVDNIYVKKTCKRLGSQNEHSDIAKKYSSSLKMTRVSRNMSLKTINIIVVYLLLC